MNKFMNLIGVKARNALKIKIDTKIKNKVFRIKWNSCIFLRNKSLRKNCSKFKNIPK